MTRDWHTIVDRLGDEPRHRAEPPQFDNGGDVHWLRLVVVTVLIAACAALIVFALAVITGGTWNQ